MLLSELYWYYYEVLTLVLSIGKYPDEVRGLGLKKSGIDASLI